MKSQVFDSAADTEQVYLKVQSIKRWFGVKEERMKQSIESFLASVNCVECLKAGFRKSNLWQPVDLG